MCLAESPPLPHFSFPSLVCPAVVERHNELGEIQPACVILPAQDSLQKSHKHTSLLQNLPSTKFHFDVSSLQSVVVGNMLEWCLPKDMDLEGVEFKAIASGSHRVTTDFM